MPRFCSMRAAEAGVLAAEPEGLVEALARALDCPALEVEPGQGVDGLRRQRRMAVRQGDLAAPAAELARGLRLVPEVVDHSATAEGLGQHVGLARPLGRSDGHVVAADGLLDTAGPLALPPLLQPNGCAGRPRFRRRPARGLRRGTPVQHGISTRPRTSRSDRPARPRCASGSGPATSGSRAPSALPWCTRCAWPRARPGSSRSSS